MDKVECVTVQVPHSHSFGGATKGSFDVVDGFEGSERYLEGERRLMVFGDTSVGAAVAAAGAVSAGALSAIVATLNEWNERETRLCYRL